MSQPERVRVELGARGYDVLIGTGLIDQAGALVRPLIAGSPRIVVVTDEQVAPLWLARLGASLELAGLAVLPLVMPAGEASKSWGHLAALVDRLLALQPDRRTMLLALGGGVIGDLAGFAAAIALRGLDFVQMPTTLLAQVDSSVGGKTGINTEAGKNLVGSFHQPRLVIADIGCLSSLPPRALRAGYAEAAKHAAIQDAPFFGWLEQNVDRLLAGEPATLARTVAHSVATKAKVVAADERESGLRALLNFGHTFGHAIETETGFSDRLLHGEAVAAGMGLAMDMSVALLGCPAEDAARLKRHLRDAGLPAGLADVPGPALAPDRLIEHMALDKKTRDGALAFVLARRLGAAELVHDVAPDAVRAVLQSSSA